MDVAGYVLGVLEPAEAAAYRGHLARCGRCQGEMSELGPVRDVLREAAPVQAPAQLWERTFAVIAAEARSSPEAKTVRPLRRRWRQPPFRLLSASPARLLIAAAVVLLAAVGGGALAGSSWLNRFPGFTTHATDAGGASSPSSEQVTLTLVAGDGGPQHGTARIRQTATGQVVDLHVQNLLPPPVGKRYTCWLVGPADTLAHPNRVALGSFTTTTAGIARVTMTSAAPRERYPIVGVTLEPNDGNPQRRGPKLLVTRPPTTVPN
jgi:hypothetical protein